MWRNVGSAAVVKVAVMGITGLIGLVTSRMIIQSYGIEAYAQYGLLASLPTLLPFADLGLAAVVINAVAESDDPRRDPKMRRALVSTVRLLLTASAVVVAVAFLLTLLDAWPVILGDGLLPGGNVVAGICLALFGISLPLTLGPRILIGLGRNTTQIATQVITAPLIFVLIGACVLFGVPADQYLAVSAYLASTVVAAIALAIAARLISPQLGILVREVVQPRKAPGVPVVNMAWPMLVQLLALPVAMQTGRILVSHLGGVSELAAYNLGYQIFGIALQTISAAGVALWPIFARARAAGRVESPWVPTFWFLGGGLVIAGGMAVISPWLASVISDGQIDLPWALITAFVVFVALQSAKYPVGMYMTDLAGLRFQVLPTIVMIPIALGGSWLLIPVLGAAGNLIAVSFAVAICQVVPNLVYVRLDVRRRRLDMADSEPVVQ
ncbi:lipopolysaccharide biosynthesis protein [Microbacterium hydrocarbonoxydans]|uniref:lipopolysaccharide biosynthesis protein n=1 Tax=Microbacterium hydrocarbonoxydans TaxID=273678 RepID=UPI00203BEAA5|nr:oligosaccharide flippase family protein [Microbacterium hydrocarbonoxydans]MCM3778115.1 oligosaccharide flippase family protein [Microbacterium hydrocarbonoxydans]